MVPDAERLAEHAGLSSERLHQELRAHLNDLSAYEQRVLAAAIDIANGGVNVSADAPDVADELISLARVVGALHPPQARHTTRTELSTRVHRTLSAKTLHTMRELGLYRDPDGVEPVWPHAGMLILNPILGCNFGCVYCFRADEQRESVDWFLSGRPTKVLEEDVLVDRLARHPLFVPGTTQLGLHTATTDPFLPQVRDSTFRILEILERRGWTNDVMIITKCYLRDQDIDRLASFTSFRILLFLTHNAAPEGMEKMGAGPEYLARKQRTVARLARWPHLAAAHYYRPIVPGWNDSEDQIIEALTFGEALGASVIGGLKEIPNLAELGRRRGLSLPLLSSEREEKYFPRELVERILGIHGRLGLTSVIVGDQSCGLTVMLSRLNRSAVPNVEGLKAYDLATGREPRCMGCCSPEQLSACAAPPVPTEDTVRSLLERAGIKADFDIKADRLVVRSEERLTERDTEFLAAHLRYAVFWQQRKGDSMRAEREVL
ncbi:hypothetical protein CG740_35360 [Streptomyces sp. CB01201]|uniref:hypothetical protein n=1 Tax=Streptomyces sp. CB01201 TaxID=2020324 RepID=UPI000C275771|nr:hypothetical protein [Streptomyces sp. CB01201]PJM98521.1 hypothetical protein CG740_35360 [Streptomyces sp. CB01201]